MSVSRANAAARDLRALLDSGTIGGLSDGQLLDRFVARREEAIFEALTHRHASMVWGVCRRVLRDHHDAEEAFQATFLVLARKAATVLPREKVGHWLYGVANQTARKARATRARRRTREIPVAEVPEPEAARRDSLVDLLPDLDLELSRLPDKYRIPIVLCELEGKSHREAGEELGWPIGTVSGRLSRARSLLGKRLAVRGLAMSSGVLTAKLAEAREAAIASLPTGLIGPTAGVAPSFAAGQAVTAGVVSAEVLTLTGEVLKAMGLIKLKYAATALILGLALAAGGTCFAYWRQVEPEPVAIPEAPQRDLIAAQPEQKKEEPVDPKASYPFEVDPDKVYEFAELTIDYREFHLKTGPVSVLPISTTRGITGAMVIGNGTFRNTPQDGPVFEGHTHAFMLRFSPEEQAKILPLEKGKQVTDRGIYEMGRLMLSVVIRHCWQRNTDNGRKQEVLIPPQGAFAADLYTKEHGDVLISGNEKTTTIFNFSTKKSIYDKK